MWGSNGRLTFFPFKGEKFLGLPFGKADGNLGPKIKKTLYNFALFGHGKDWVFYDPNPRGPTPGEKVLGVGTPGFLKFLLRPRRGVF